MIYLNGKPLDYTQFPDNTSQVWKLPESDIYADKALIVWEFSHEGEFMVLAQLKHLLNWNGIPAYLRLTYLPYGRQDKTVSNATTFALHTFASLLNALDFWEVIIEDPHSEIALQLIEKSKAVYPIKQVEQTAQELDREHGGCTVFCYPDKGALAKYSKVYESCYRPYIYGEKVRDQLTGNITSYQVVGDPAGQNILIVDDICDGGATFKILAKELLAKGAKSVGLFVSHGIFSKGVRTLFESGIQRVFTKDGEISERHGSFHI